MAEPAELTPTELDHLEDALEGLELAPPPGELSAAVRGRLQDYRQILTLSRAAMPMVEVPRGLLDSVLAEARAAAEVPSITPVDAVPSKRESLWTRLRRAALLPGVALATTAALVLIMVERKDEAAPSLASNPAVARVEPTADQTAVAPTSTATPRAVEAQELEQAPAAAPEPYAAGVAAPGEAPPPPPVAPAPARAELRTEDDRAIGGELAEKKNKGKADDAAPIAAPTVADQETTPRWDIIARGDRARQKSDCATARSEYKLALGDLDARVRARAHAGIGLCEAAMGNRSAADAAYEQARALDAEIAGFIEDERPRGAGSKPPNAAKASAKKAKAAPPLLDDAFERDDAALE